MYRLPECARQVHSWNIFRKNSLSTKFNKNHFPAQTAESLELDEEEEEESAGGSIAVASSAPVLSSASVSEFKFSTEGKIQSPLL